MASRTPPQPSPSRRRQLVAVPLGLIALVGLGVFLVDYLGSGPAGPVRIVGSILFVTGTALATLILLGEERSKKAAVVTAGLIPVIVVLIQLPGPGTEPDPDPAPLSSCGVGKQQIDTLDRERDYRQEPTMANVRYTVQKVGAQLYFSLNARISGRPQPGSTLYLLATADPGTSDSLVPPNPGFTEYTFFGPISAAASGCWSVPRARLGYPGFCGVTAIFVVG